MSAETARHGEALESPDAAGYKGKMPASAEAAHHPSVLAHHFEDLEQQRGAARLGMWLFLATEVMFFGGVFGAYTAYRIWYPEAFAAGSSRLNVLIAGINSILLLTSSLTITLAIHAAHAGERKRTQWCLALTVILGLAFLGFKAVEYTQDYFEGLVPGTAAFYAHVAPELEAEGVNPAQVQLFLMFYYSMTGLHVVHMLVGIGVVVWLWLLAYRGVITSERYPMIEISSLYWHFVDMVWIFLVPLLYLAGNHTLSQLHL